MAYDDDNIFAKILRGEIPCDKVHETDHSLAFRDINPQTPVHVLVIPKGKYVSMDDFSANASDAEQADGAPLARSRMEGIVENGYRVLSNIAGWAPGSPASSHARLRRQESRPHDQTNR